MRQKDEGTVSLEKALKALTVWLSEVDAKVHIYLAKGPHEWKT
jgi:hypothetical protein